MALVFRRTNQSTISFEAVSGELVVGSIRKDTSGNLDRWCWFLSAVTGPSSVVRGRGFGEDEDACKAELEADWQRWLQLAGLREPSD
jgi:hypothetical protein